MTDRSAMRFLLPIFFFPLFCLPGAAPLPESQPELVRCIAAIDRNVLPAGKKTVAVASISLITDAAATNVPRAPVNLCLVLDRSGSMEGDKLHNAKEAAIEAVQHLGESDIFSLVTYNSSIDTVLSAAPMQNRNQVFKAINGIEASGNTALFGGLSQGAAEIRKNLGDGRDNYVHRIVLLSDGRANVGPSSASQLGRLGTSLLKEQVSVSTIGVGNDYAEDLMTSLAARSDGNTYFVRTSEELPDVFAEELGDILNIIARNVQVTINCGKGVRPLRVVGRTGSIRGNTVHVRLNQLYRNQQKTILVELEVDENAPDSAKALLTAQCSYDPIDSSGKRAKTVAVKASFSNAPHEVVLGVNPSVMHSVLMNRSAEAKNKAIYYYDNDKPNEAHQVLQQNSILLRNAGQAYRVQELTDESKRLEYLDEKLQRDGLTKEQRKQLRTEATQQLIGQRYQQERTVSSESTRVDASESDASF